MAQAFEVFTVDPEERFAMVHATWRDGDKRRAQLTAREAKKTLQAAVKTMMGELSGVDMDVLTCDAAKSCFVVRTNATHLRALWLAISCVENVEGAPCVMRVVRVSSTLVGVSGSSRPGL
jgi:RNase P/RNase MRP subunit POP5